MRDSNYYGSKHNPGMKTRGYKGNPTRTDMLPRGKSTSGGNGTPHPNGGSVRPLDMAQSKMPRRHRAAKVSHTPLNVPREKMPRSMGGGRQTMPERR